ncbi:MAG: hypothetical protein ACRDVL_07120 [Acidimicrobiia bacterium]
MTNREPEDRRLALYLGLGLLLGTALGALGLFFSGDEFWIAVGAGAGLILATAFGVGLGPDQG